LLRTVRVGSFLLGYLQVKWTNSALRIEFHIKPLAANIHITATATSAAIVLFIGASLRSRARPRATELDLPNPTTHRTLEELAAHRVIARKSQGQGKADLWRVNRWARSLHHAATSSEKSVAPIFPFTKPKTIDDDFSEEVRP
jgi:hypothetical protein